MAINSFALKTMVEQKTLQRLSFFISRTKKALQIGDLQGLYFKWNCIKSVPHFCLRKRLIPRQ